MVRKLLTIGIPTFNRSKMLKLSLKSLVMQIEPYSEYIDIVISDNCSDDDTEKVAKEFCNTTKFIRYYKNNKNIGINNNVYRIVHQYTNSEFLWIIGDDDMIVNGGIPLIINSIIKNHDIKGFYINYGVTTIINRDDSIKNNNSNYDFELSDIFIKEQEEVKLDSISQLITKASNPIATFFAISCMIVKTSLWEKYTEWDKEEMSNYTVYKYAYPHMRTFMQPFVNSELVCIGKPIFMFASHDREDGINGNLIFKWMKDYRVFLNELNIGEKDKKLMSESCNKMIFQSFSYELIQDKLNLYDQEIIYGILNLIRTEKDTYKEVIADIVMDKHKKIISLFIDKIKFEELQDLIDINEALKQMNLDKKEAVIFDYYKNMSSNLIEEFIIKSNNIYIWGSSEVAYSIYKLIKEIDNNIEIKIVDGYYRNVGKYFYDTGIIIEKAEVVKNNSKIIISSLNNYSTIKNRINSEYKNCEIL